MKLAEFAAIIAGADGQHSGPGRSADGGGHGPADARLIAAIDHDLVGTVDPIVKLRGNPAP